MEHAVLRAHFINQEPMARRYSPSEAGVKSIRAMSYLSPRDQRPCPSIIQTTTALVCPRNISHPIS
ncbi:hypothetical protein FS749_002961 [Ceratobasidium sp. UAMH 11750]|nr:hypothetical protein FS749_002961 [Ceratobasidium sp. UAMH 11750]